MSPCCAGGWFSWIESTGFPLVSAKSRPGRSFISLKWLNFSFQKKLGAHSALVVVLLATFGDPFIWLSTRFWWTSCLFDLLSFISPFDRFKTLLVYLHRKKFLTRSRLIAFASQSLDLYLKLLILASLRSFIYCTSDNVQNFWRSLLRRLGYSWKDDLGLVAHRWAELVTLFDGYVISDEAEEVPVAAELFAANGNEAIILGVVHQR